MYFWYYLSFPDYESQPNDTSNVDNPDMSSRFKSLDIKQDCRKHISQGQELKHLRKRQDKTTDKESKESNSEAVVQGIFDK